ncbi:AAA family ATPase [Vibrio diabolicus]|uniref:AAA family ATPase n=1 Tax=Vibrio diabolicus TaxID=50719 RepID=UPI002160FF11|nr:AAA family ATPase [Vibrio diabolicus]MCS0397891.1 AAA family ATPase [Vibrio diabolicus]
MTHYTTETENLTPLEALNVSKRAKQGGCKEVTMSASNERDASLLYLAAKHIGLCITGVSYGGGDPERISRKVKKLCRDEWNEFISEHRIKVDMTMMNNFSPPGTRSPTIGPVNKLNNLTGLTPVKKQVNDVIALQKMIKQRRNQGLPELDISQHLIFTGNPGTGKTTVARIIGDIYSELGILKKGHFVEIDGRGLIAEYIGQTAQKTQEIVTSALDGILFIDEAYALTPNDSERDFGQEAIATLIKMVEDYRHRLVVVMAGYDKEMEHMMNSNPGLKSRFKTKIHFPDYSESELCEIFVGLCIKYKYSLSEQARQKANTLFSEMYKRRDKHFGNGRSVRNCFDRTIMNQAIRIDREETSSARQIELIYEKDIPDISDIEW